MGLINMVAGLRGLVYNLTTVVKKLDLYKLSAYLAVFGICLALYLFYEYLAPAHRSVCYLSSTINCEASTKGVLSKTLEIPTALWGLTGYIFILISALRKWRRVLLGVATFGLLFCLRITFLEVFVIHIICPVCLACQVDMIILFILGIILNLNKTSKSASD